MQYMRGISFGLRASCTRSSLYRWILKPHKVSYTAQASARRARRLLAGACCLAVKLHMFVLLFIIVGLSVLQIKQQNEEE